MGEDGVSVPTKPENNGRDENGRFTRGNPGGPGRPSQRQEVAMLSAIKASMPPERIQALLDEVLAMADTSNSWRAKMAVIEFGANYTIGKPIQRIVTTEGGLADMAEELGIDLNDE